jgi:LPXTG-site transpeptidase (sortase) family protein
VTSTDPKPRSATDSAITKIAIGLVVVLALLALVVGMSSGSSSSSSAPSLLLGPAAPMKVTVPSISASSSLVPTGVLPDGSLDVPPLSQPMQASWYDKSPTPGQPGPAVVLGHVNGNGRPGIFANLDKVKAGEEVMIDRADGQTAVFTVSHVDTVPKDNFPTADVYNDTPDSQVRLITCGGDLDRAAHSYLSNVIVYGNLTSVRPTVAAAP